MRLSWLAYRDYFKKKSWKFTQMAFRVLFSENRSPIWIPIEWKYQRAYFDTCKDCIGIDIRYAQKRCINQQVRKDALKPNLSS